MFIRSILFSMALISQSLWALPIELLTFEGEIESVTAQPFPELGNACVVEVATTTQEHVGFLTGFNDCLDSADELLIGRGVTVVVEAKDQIREGEILGVLQAAVPADRFFLVDFGHLENGLANPQP